MNLGVHQNVLIVIGGIFGILIVASATVFFLKRLRPGIEIGEIERRVKSWWVMVIVFTVAMVLNRMVSLIFFCLVSVLAFREYVSLVPTRREDRPVLLWAYLAILLQFFWIAYEWYGMFIIWIPVYMFLFVPLRLVLIGETKGFLRSVGTLQWGLMITVYTVSHLAYLLILPDPGNARGGGPALVLYLVFLTQFNDVAQFLWGKALGRHKVTPRVSPNKTVEGLLGGLATTVLLAWLLAPWLTPFDLRESLIAGVLIAMAGFVGDIVISALKRDLEIKDSGTMLPGHGGILDRLDSLTYTAPLFFHFVYYTHY